MGLGFLEIRGAADWGFGLGFQQIQGGQQIGGLGWVSSGFGEASRLGFGLGFQQIRGGQQIVFAILKFNLLAFVNLLVSFSF